MGPLPVAFGRGGNTDFLLSTFLLSSALVLSVEFFVSCGLLAGSWNATNFTMGVGCAGRNAGAGATPAGTSPAGTAPAGAGKALAGTVPGIAAPGNGTPPGMGGFAALGSLALRTGRSVIMVKSSDHLASAFSISPRD